MVSKVLGMLCRRATLGVAAVALAAGAGVAKADAAKSPFSVSFGLDAQSHFISYGLDTWGGGGKISPVFTNSSTINAYETVTCAVADNLSVFVNVWSDLNNNGPQSLGGDVQEIDLNTGVTYTTADKIWSFTLAHGFWNYAGDTEKILDFTVAYADGDKISHSADWSLNPNVVLHYRYDGNNGQDTGAALVPGIRPAWTFSKDTKYPVTVAVPVNLALFTNNFQGGDAGYGFFSAGGVVSIPLTFINETGKYGTWTASAGVTYWNTPNDAIPGNPDENFLTSFLSIGLSF